ncbi:MAG TPA: exodeoxyribonuclease VII small subunit [Coriobacteriia bacterium]
MAEGVPAPDTMRFSEALAELEAIVAALESGQLDLEDGLARYERGVSLLRACQAKLAEAEQKVSMLMGELDAGDVEEDAAD